MRLLRAIVIVGLLGVPPLSSIAFSQTAETTRTATKPVAASPGTAVGDRREIVRKARLAYYNLRNEGLQEFRCSVQLDWDAIYGSLPTDEVGRQQVLPLLRKSRFRVAVGPDGASTISQELDAAPPNQEAASRVRSTLAGTEQILTGFFQAWSPFLFGTLLPETDSNYEVVDLGEKYQLSAKEGGVELAMLIGKDFAIQEMIVSTAQFKGRIEPTLTRKRDLFLLAGYSGTFEFPSNATQQLRMAVEYSTVEGLELPSVVTAKMKLPSSEISIPLQFVDYNVKKR